MVRWLWKERDLLLTFGSTYLCAHIGTSWTVLMNNMHAEQRMGMAMGQNPDILSEVITFFCIKCGFCGCIVWCWNDFEL